MSSDRLTVSSVRFAWPGSSEDCIAIDKLTVATGETLFLQGPSGSGKSTLLGLLAGVLVPQHGAVYLDNTSWSALPRSSRDAFRGDHIGYIFQQFNLVPYLTARENVLLPCRLSKRRCIEAGGSQAMLHEEAERLLDAMQLEPPAWDRKANHLSVGQQQRVAAARALIGNPEIVIADEPTSALDAAVRDRFMSLLLEQCRALRTTLIFVSHDERLASFFHRTILLSDINQAARAMPAGVQG